MKAKPAIPPMDLSMFDSLSVSDLKGGDGGAGHALRIPLSDVVEDPENARQHFDSDELAALASTIAERGVIEPILVHPRSADGKYMLHSGARRYRASLLAGLSDIPAIVRDDLDVFDRYIVNSQRVGYQPLETARFIEERISQGKMSKQEIARRMGRSPSYVTQHHALLQLPDPLKELLACGRCADVTILYQLGKLYAKAPAVVEAGIREPAEITRGLVARLQAEAEPAAVGVAAPMPAPQAGEESEPGKAEPSPKRRARVHILVTYAGEQFILRHDMPASSPRMGYIQTGSSEPIEVELGELALDSIIEV